MRTHMYVCVYIYIYTYLSDQAPFMYGTVALALDHPPLQLIIYSILY